MTVSSRRRNLCALPALVVLAVFLAACAKIPISPTPPYPSRTRDYTYPTPPPSQPPWQDPQDYPYVTITAPLDGAFVAAGEVTVTGTYAGPAVQTLTLNDNAITVSGGQFSATVTVGEDDVNFPIVVMATTTNGKVSSDRVTVWRGQVATADSPVDYALLVDLENRGLDNVSSFLSAALSGRDITQLLNNLINPPLQKKPYADVVVIDKALIQGFSLLLQAQADGLHLNLTASVTIDLTLFGVYPLTIDLEGVTADLLTNLTVDVNNKLVFDIISGTFNIAQVNLSGPLIPPFIGDLISLLSGTLWDLLLKNLVVTELNSLLGGLTINLNVGGATIGLLPASTLLTAHDFALAFDTTAALPADWQPGIQPDGFLVTPSTPPTFNETTPNGDLPYGVAVALNDDIVNQLLYLLAASGGLNLDLQDPILTAELLSVIFFSFENIDPHTPVIVQFRPTVAPVVVGNADGDMELRLPAYTGYVMVDRGADGLWEALSFAVDLTASTKLLVTAQNTITLDLSGLGIAINVIHNPVGQANIPNINHLLAEVFDAVLPDLLGQLVGSMEITIPEIGNLNLNIPEIGAIGPNYDYLGLFIDLIY
jgi:hypothetical protein